LLLGGFLEGEAAPEEFGEAAARSR
jgi:hypothetical protein